MSLAGKFQILTPSNVTREHFSNRDRVQRLPGGRASQAIAGRLTLQANELGDARLAEVEQLVKLGARER